MKVSLSMSVEDLAFLDAETRDGRYASRSAATQEAVRLLRESRLADAYAAAYAEDDGREWDAVVGDGLGAA